PQGIDLQSDENGVLRQKGNSLIMEDLEIPYGSTQTLKMTHQPIEGFGMNQDIYTISVSDDGQPSVTVNRGGGLSRSQEPVDYTFEDGLLRFVIYSGLNLDFLLQKVDGDNPTSHQILNAAFNLSEYKGNQWSDVTSFKSATQMPNSEFSSIDDLSTKDGKLDLSQIVTDTPNLSRGVIYKLTETKQPDGFQKSLYSILVYKDIDQQVYVRLAEQENGQLLMKDFKDVYPDMMTVSEENSKVQINFPNYREVGNGPKKENGSNGKEQEFSPFGVYAGLGALILGIALAILARVGYKYRHK
ncbi:MAG: hypothetical protein FWF42_04620, partial [Streptococcaceae bacterium]|nr:hypothetical protein [Streptococcaceae bacterium]